MRDPSSPRPPIADNRVKVGPLEAIDGTPIVDIKPVLAVEDH